MESVDINATRDQIEEFKESVLWRDMVAELMAWKEGFNQEMLSIVDEAAESNPSSASILLHMGDLNGRQKAVDYILGLPDLFLQVLEDKKDQSETNLEVS